MIEVNGKKCGSFVSPTYAIDDTPNDGWHSFPTVNIPSIFNYGRVYNYLIESLQNADEDDLEVDCCIDNNASTAKPRRKGRTVLDSGFVEDLQDVAIQHAKRRLHIESPCSPFNEKYDPIERSRCNQWNKWNCEAVHLHMYCKYLGTLCARKFYSSSFK